MATRRLRGFLASLLVGLSGLLHINTACAADPSVELPGCATGAKHCLALEVWLPGGQEPSLRSWLRTQLEVANDRLAPVGIGVQVVSVRSLAPAQLDVDSVAKRTALGALGAQRPLRWFVVDHLADDRDRDRARRGVTWRNGGDFWIIQDKAAWRWVLAHELGHVLGLGHSTEAASIMNKTARAWPPPWRIGFTSRERPTMRRTVKHLVGAGRLQLATAGRKPK